jgi:hypothetical protein
LEAEVGETDACDHNQFSDLPSIPQTGFLMVSVFAIQVISCGDIVCRIKVLEISISNE